MHLLDNSPELRRLVARLRFKHLQLLVQLRDGGSLRAAAAALNVTQPALSKALTEMENAFAFRLFDRSARGLTPTARGVVVIRGAVLLLEELAHMREEAAAETADTVLRIGAPPFVAQGLLADVFTKLLTPADTAPMGLRLQLREERVPVLVELLLDGQVDALVTSYPIELPEDTAPSLRYERLFDVDYAVVAPAAHPLTRARAVDWQRLAREPWIMPPTSSLVRRLVDEAFRREGVTPPRPLIESVSAFTNLRFVAAGLGLSAAPDSALVGNQPHANVRRVRVRPALPPAPVALISRMGTSNARTEILRRALQSIR